MKSIKFFNSLIASLLFAFVFGVSFAIVLHVDPIYTISGLLLMSAIATVVKRINPANVFFDAVYREVWTGEVVKQISNAEIDTFLDGIPDYSRYVSAVGDEAQAIHLVYMGVEPDVLINNTTYPIDEQALGEQDIVIQLDKFQTKRTPVTDDELYSLSYKKIGEVSASHGTSIIKTKLKKSIHALGPSGNTAYMPVILTTGDDDGTGRKMLTFDDIISFRRKLTALQINIEGGRIVLCSDHLNDLLSADQKFKDQYYQGETGKLFKRLGFEFRDYAVNPYYNEDSLLKKSLGATPGQGDYQASVFFLPGRCAKATGWTKFYFSPASTDPAYQRNMMNYRHYYITLPKREDGRGAIVSASV